MDAAGSPACGDEGRAPAGFIFAAGVLAFAAAVPAFAFSPLGVPEPAPAPPAASNDETGATARARAKVKAHNDLFNIIFLLVLRTGATTRLQRGRRGVVVYHRLHFTLIRPTVPPIPSLTHICYMTIVTSATAESENPTAARSKPQSSRLRRGARRFPGRLIRRPVFASPSFMPNGLAEAPSQAGGPVALRGCSNRDFARLPSAVPSRKR